MKKNIMEKLKKMKEAVDCGAECENEDEKILIDQFKVIGDLYIEDTNTKLDELYLKTVTRLSEAHSHVIYDEQVSQQLMKNLGYYDSDISQMFTLFDGVANPFHFVKIQPG